MFSKRLALSLNNASRLIVGRPSVTLLLSQQRAFTTSSIVFKGGLTSVPQPTSEYPDFETFLRKIGRDAHDTADTFESWDHFMTITSAEMKEKGIDTRLRRYIIDNRFKFSQGETPKEIKRGKKSWGGERKRKENMSVFLRTQRNQHRSKMEENKKAIDAKLNIEY
ncbi:hypothetical protein NADFUDRAFT_40470 [Nadsonia fulvescens var. elongata DSM 6958]|uniref:Small ribosomal subunit protein mS41 n=1 Tax=Nadsonia fulvescens var. elongata DSM 6958 TaxID=857566 RepID=A0A1E3PPZ1_9ASCO|nr:hypothetical protein NADFUDRAFT_40470 [Nadsonia fulvescens var. elongata DSM 6958]